MALSGKRVWLYMVVSALSLVLASAFWTTLVKAAPSSSEFCLLAVPSEEGGGDFPVENLTITPEAVEPGESVRITVDVFNNGTEAALFTVILKIKGPADPEFDPIAVKELNLPECEKGTIRFFVEREELGRYEVEIEGLTGAFDVLRSIDPADSLVILANEPAEFVAENLVVTPTAVAPGESVKITVDIINEGARPEAFSPILKLKRPGQDGCRTHSGQGYNAPGWRFGRGHFLRRERGARAV